MTMKRREEKQRTAPTQGQESKAQRPTDDGPKALKGQICWVPYLMRLCS